MASYRRAQHAAVVEGSAPCPTLPLRVGEVLRGLGIRKNSMDERLMMRDSDYRQALTAFSKRVRDKLIRLDQPAFTDYEGLAIARQKTVDGWSATLGGVSASGLDQVVAYLDQTLPTEEPHFWVGFFVGGAGRARGVAEHLMAQVGKATLIRDGDVRKDGEGYRIVRALRPAEYARPVMEIYRTGTKSYGRFVGECTRVTPRAEQVTAAVEFLARCLDGLRDLAAARARESYERPIAQAIVSTTVYRRNQALARQAKLRDGYRCSVCDMDPVERYGELGRSCLEAHHVEALHTGRNTTESVASLTTVCANCHRVLGRLSPDERGLADLQKRFKPSTLSRTRRRASG